MSSPRPVGMLLAVHGELRAARDLVEEFFAGRGWQAQERGPGRIDFEIGSRRRTVLLGAFAGRSFHLVAPIALHEGPGGLEIRYLWGESAGRALGGATGRARAARVHLETAAALAQRFQAEDRLVGTRQL